MVDSPSDTIRDPFTQSWIQALTLAADNPVARTIKPTMELIDRVSKDLPGVDRQAAAKEFWEFAQRERLSEMLWLLPSLQMNWVFDRDDNFAFTRRADPESPGSRELTSWLSAVGIDPLDVPLTAEVTSGDWAGLVRKEAVRLQKSLSLTSNQTSSTLHLPCRGLWDKGAWRVQFEQADWVVRRYEDVPTVNRISMDDLEERVLLSLGDADDTIRTKSGPASTRVEAGQPWVRCVSRLIPLHELVHQSSAGYSDWLIRCWYCAWPIVYREQNVLQGKADVVQVRQELKACLAAQPRLTVWMIVMARLVCQAAIGRGLGFCADFRD